MDWDVPREENVYVWELRSVPKYTCVVTFLLLGLLVLYGIRSLKASVLHNIPVVLILAFWSVVVVHQRGGKWIVIGVALFLG